MLNPCQQVEQQLASLKAQEAALSQQQAQDLMEATSSGKAAVIAEYKKEKAELDQKLTAARLSVEDCHAKRDVIVDGPEVPGLDAFDLLVQKFMHANHVRAGQLTILKNGLPLLMHAYTYPMGDAGFTHTKPSSLFRIASCSKAFTCACIAQLYADKKVMPNTPAFSFVGITQPAVGPKQDFRVDQITVQQLVDHTGGWNDHGPVGTIAGTNWDPVFHVREIATALGKTVPPTKKEIAAYMYGQPLQFAPGTQTLQSTQGASYSNFGYLLLGLVVEKASGLSYIDYLRNSILKPLGLEKHIFVAPMLSSFNNALEVHYDDPGMGLNALQPTSNQLVPYAYGGEGYITELMDSGGGLMTTATTLTLFSHVRATWGLGGRTPGLARSGGMAGVSSLMTSRMDDVDYAYIFNTRHFAQSGDPLGDFNKQLEYLFKTVPIPTPQFHLPAM
jgi:CubicO group peptidase (beta-lactamase class C family)